MRATTWFLTDPVWGLIPYPFKLRTPETLDRIEVGDRAVHYLRQENGRWTR